jgi:hypothetical protein
MPDEAGRDGDMGSPRDPAPRPDTIVVRTGWHAVDVDRVAADDRPPHRPTDWAGRSVVDLLPSPRRAVAERRA